MDLTPSVLTIALTLPHPLLPSPSKRWKEIITLAKNNSYSELISALTRQNIKEERERLEIQWIKKCDQLISEKRCLSFFCKNYPVRWKYSLGDNAPPSLWWNQVVPDFCVPSVSIVGNRQIQPYVKNWTIQCANLLAQEGFLIISGGAIGVDQAAAIGSLQADKIPIEILPFGIDREINRYSACRFSNCSSQAIFSTSNAMSRNRLIYAYSPHTIVIQSHEKRGGTWHGAVNALQKRLSHIHIWNHPENKGFSRLVESGAIPFSNLEELLFNLHTSHKEEELFSI